MFERFVERRAEEALSDTPVVLIVGPRRAGKTTLVRKMGEAVWRIISKTHRRQSSTNSLCNAGGISRSNGSQIYKIENGHPNSCPGPSSAPPEFRAVA